MSKNKDLFKEAIADAKQVREAALQNAKIALEEALTPKLQSMISAKLQEMDGEDEEMEEGFTSPHVERNIDFLLPEEMEEEGYGHEEELEEDFDLSEILAELDEEKEEMEEAKKKHGKKKEEELEEAKKKHEKEEMKEAKEDEESITDLSVEELKDIIKDIIHSELEQEEEETPADEESEEAGEEFPGEEEEGNESDEVDLEELLAELNSLDENYGMEEEGKEMEEGVADWAKKIAALPAEKLAKLKKLWDTELSPSAIKKGAPSVTLPSNRPLEEKKKKEEMEEALSTIATLRKELNETNLLNAKLLYVNKIFKAKNLSESQKLAVIASFDKATTPKQAKALYESIQSSNLGSSKKSIVKESLGFASKAIGTAPRKQIIDSNDQFARWAKLANIK